MKKFIILIIVMTLFASCSSLTYIKAEITDPAGQVFAYSGPKDIDMKAGGIEFSGKTPGFWEGIMQYLLTKPDINIER